jgi:hypothetical protein
MPRTQSRQSVKEKEDSDFPVPRTLAGDQKEGQSTPEAESLPTGLVAGVRSEVEGSGP